MDVVRDLMSPLGKEMHYKNGMKKDPDGFTDIEWCSSAVLNSWDDLRTAFRAANARKAIAPTQASGRQRRKQREGKDGHAPDGRGGTGEGRCQQLR